MQKKFTGKNVTLISTVIKHLATGSLRLEIKNTKNPTSGNLMAKNETSETLSLKKPGGENFI